VAIHSILKKNNETKFLTSLTLKKKINKDKFKWKKRGEVGKKEKLFWKKINKKKKSWKKNENFFKKIITIIIHSILNIYK